jgi:hypothetical protein
VYVMKKMDAQQNVVELLKWNIEDIKERLEELLEQELCIPIMLDVECSESPRFFLHEYNEDNLTNEDLSYLANYCSLNTTDKDHAWITIQHLLNIKVERIN